MAPCAQTAPGRFAKVCSSVKRRRFNWNYFLCSDTFPRLADGFHIFFYSDETRNPAEPVKTERKKPREQAPTHCETANRLIHHRLWAM